MSWLMSYLKDLKAGPKPGEPGAPPLSNLSPRAMQTLALARKEAARFNHNFVGTEHLLLGLIAIGEGTAAKILTSFGLNLETLRGEIERQVGVGPGGKHPGNIPYTPRVKKILWLAGKEAGSMNCCKVGTGHILLGILSEGDGVAARVLRNLGVETEKTKQAALNLLHADAVPRAEASGMTQNLQDPEQPSSESGIVDTVRRYDIYCSERSQQIVVYRNARFKSRKRLLSTPPHGLGTDFLELEMADGQNVYVSAFSVVRFCESGASVSGELVS